MYTVVSYNRQYIQFIITKIPIPKIVKNKKQQKRLNQFLIHDKRYGTYVY